MDFNKTLELLKKLNEAYEAYQTDGSMAEDVVWLKHKVEMSTSGTLFLSKDFKYCIAL